MTAISLIKLIHQLEIRFDHFKNKIPGRAPVHIQLYFCFGTPWRIFLKGRVMEQKRILPVSTRDRFWINLFNAFQRYESDEVPFAQLRLLYGGEEKFVTADEEGYFASWLFLPGMTEDDFASLRVRLELSEPVRLDQSQPTVETIPVIIPETCRLGIISDIDDTVIRTDVFKPLKMLVNVFFKSSRLRQSFPGTSIFYQAMSSGVDGKKRNPIFYASTSPWNLHDLLVNYLAYQGFPPNPILYLRDWGINENELLPMDNFGHKNQFIQMVLEFFPDIRFILIGDSGQQDPEIYAGVSDDYAGRILAIYLREVTGRPQRIDSIHRLRARLARRGVPVILAESVLPMAEHAARQGWISPVVVDQIREQVKPG